MSILTHGSDLSLAPAVGPLVRQSGANLRTTVRPLVGAGFASVQLDATLPGLRPRELGRRARKDLLALLRREGASVAGVDLFIPREHFVDAQHVDRAVSALTAAIELCADLGRVPLSTAMPVAEIDKTIGAALAESADAHDVALAVHDEEHAESLASWLAQLDAPQVGAGIDPAALLALKADPTARVHQLGAHVRVGRLSDWTLPDRRAVGDGDLNVSEYRIALDLATSRRGPVVLDLRGMAAPLDAARQAIKVWDGASFVV